MNDVSLSQSTSTTTNRIVDRTSVKKRMMFVDQKNIQISILQHKEEEYSKQVDCTRRQWEKEKLNWILLTICKKIPLLVAQDLILIALKEKF